MVIDALDLGGAETHVVALANELARMGHEVTVVSGGGRLAHTLTGVKHIRLKSFKKRAFFRLFFRLFRLFRKEKFDVIHAHTRFSAFLCRPLARKRLAVTAHWVFDTRFPKKQLSAWGDRVLAVSPDIKDYLKREYGCAEERITVTVNGIDCERFRPEKNERRVLRIVCCTRMDADRADAAFALLEAARELPCDQVSIAIIGDGDRFEELRQRHARLKREHPKLDVRLIGGVSNVAPYLNDADIFVGVSRAALEGMASGCATVLAGNEGYLSVFRPSNAHAAEQSNFCCRGAKATIRNDLTTDLLFLLRLPLHELRRMGEENRRYVLSRYTASRMARDAISVYERICKHRCVLCGYYGFGNVGDTLLLRALTEKLKKEGYGYVLPLSAKRLSPRAFVSLKKGYDLILGGGNLLQDATSRRSLSFYLFCAKRARRTEIYGGLGPLSQEGEERVKTLLQSTALFHARTKADLAYAEALGATRVRLSADTVLTLPFPKKETGERILLALRKPKEKEVYDLFAFVKRLCRTFGEDVPIIFPMHPRDRDTAKQLAKICGISYYEGGEKEFLSLLTECRAVIASRLHAGICALGVGIPFLLWEGEEKCRFFIHDLTSESDKGDFCGLFSFRDRIRTLPKAEGIEAAKERMRKRI